MILAPIDPRPGESGHLGNRLETTPTGSAHLGRGEQTLAAFVELGPDSFKA